MAEIRIDIDDRAVQQALRSLKSGVDNLEEPMREIGEFYVERVDRRFETQGPAWKPLSPKYQRWKQRQPRAIDKILQFSGLLRASIHYQASVSEVAIGSDKIYASKQERTRSFLKPDQDDEREFADIVLEHLRRASL